MKVISYKQRNRGHRKTLCLGAPRGPAWYQIESMPLAVKV